MKLFDGVELLEGEVGGRPLLLPLLIGEWKSILLDTGCAGDVERLILPGLTRLGMKPSALSYIINTHCDGDHQGGNHGIKQAAPQALLCCAPTVSRLNRQPPSSRSAMMPTARRAFFTTPKPGKGSWHHWARPKRSI